MTSIPLRVTPPADWSARHPHRDPYFATVWRDGGLWHTVVCGGRLSSPTLSTLLLAVGWRVYR